jgi:hypothetical protein
MPGGAAASGPPPILFWDNCLNICLCFSMYCLYSFRAVLLTAEPTLYGVWLCLKLPSLVL